MQSFALIYALLLASAAADGPNTFSRQVCLTALRTSKGSGGTTTKSSTQYLTRTVTYVVTPTSTVFPPSATVVKRMTTTKWSTKTLPQSTSTFSTTVSFTDTSTAWTTLISTLTSSITETTTSTFATTTISPSPNFVPIQSALAAQGHTAAKRARRGVGVSVRDPEPLAVEKRATQQRIVCGEDGTITYDPPQYKGLVTCYKRVQVVATKTITSTAKKTKTILASRGTITQTSTSTKVQTTVTQLPVAPSTITVSTTSTLSTTLTVSSASTTSITSSSTVYAPQSTFWAVCSSSNIVSYVDNTRIANIAVVDAANGFSFGSITTSAYDCCVQCAMTGTCGGSTYHPASGTCYMFALGTSGTCSPTEEVGTFSKGSGSTTVGFVVSNSNCGEVEFAG